MDSEDEDFIELYDGHCVCIVYQDTLWKVEWNNKEAITLVETRREWHLLS